MVTQHTAMSGVQDLQPCFRRHLLELLLGRASPDTYVKRVQDAQLVLGGNDPVHGRSTENRLDFGSC